MRRKLLALGIVGSLACPTFGFATPLHNPRVTNGSAASERYPTYNVAKFNLEQISVSEMLYHSSIRPSAPVELAARPATVTGTVVCVTLIIGWACASSSGQVWYQSADPEK